MRKTLIKLLIPLMGFALIAGACSSDGDSDDASSEPTEESSAPSEDESATTMAEDDAEAVDSSTICETDELVEAVESGPDEGTLAGMTDDPVGTAASSNPVLTTLVAAVTEAELVDTLNSAEALTVFAPTDCAFAELDPATLEAAMADPTGLLTTVLGFHVVAGEQLDAAALGEMTEIETFTGEILPIEVDGDTITLNGGQAVVQVPDIQTANATVHLIDAVMIPPSAG